jgi:hypothetical protein
MKDIIAWFGLKRFPFDKNIKTQDLFDAEPATSQHSYISAGFKTHPKASCRFEKLTTYDIV